MPDQGNGRVGKKLGGSGVAATRPWEGLDHYAPNRHDTGSTTARSVDEVALNSRHYKPVCACVDRILSIPNRRTGDQKKFSGAPAGRVLHPWPDQRFGVTYSR